MDLYNRTPLHPAAQGGYSSTVELLTRNGASIEAMDNASQTPLQLAKYWGHSDIRATPRKQSC